MVRYKMQPNYIQPEAPGIIRPDQIPPDINPETGKPWEKDDREKDPENDRVIIIDPNKNNDGWT